MAIEMCSNASRAHAQLTELRFAMMTVECEWAQSGEADLREKNCKYVVTSKYKPLGGGGVSGKVTREPD